MPCSTCWKRTGSQVCLSVVILYVGKPSSSVELEGSAGAICEQVVVQAGLPSTTVSSSLNAPAACTARTAAPKSTPVRGLAQRSGGPSG